MDAHIMIAILFINSFANIHVDVYIMGPFANIHNMISAGIYNMDSFVNIYNMIFVDIHNRNMDIDCWVIQGLVHRRVRSLHGTALIYSRNFMITLCRLISGVVVMIIRVVFKDSDTYMELGLGRTIMAGLDNGRGLSALGLIFTSMLAH